MHSEAYHMEPDAWTKVQNSNRTCGGGNHQRKDNRNHRNTGKLAGDTNIYIYPGYEFQRVGAMLTNFHLPQTSLMLLVCAFAGKDLALAAYRHAVKERYRFFSYGDCMLIV